MSNYLTEKAMLVMHATSNWSGRKFDKKVTKQIAEFHGVKAEDAGRFNKLLLAKGSMKEIGSIISQAKDHHYMNTLPWEDTGPRILPAKNYFAYMEAQRKFVSQLETAVGEFAVQYPGYIEEAKVRLNGMFNEADYPTVQEITEHFGIFHKVSPVPDSNDFRVKLADDEVTKIKADIEERMQSVIKTAVEEIWLKLYDVVETMSDRLSRYSPKDSEGDGDLKRFYGSWIDNVKEIVDLVPNLNFTNDRDLENVRARVERRLLKHESDTLKASETIRTETVTAANDILQQMAGYIGEDVLESMGLPVPEMEDKAAA